MGPRTLCRQALLIFPTCLPERCNAKMFSKFPSDSSPELNFAYQSWKCLVFISYYVSCWPHRVCATVISHAFANIKLYPSKLISGTSVCFPPYVNRDFCLVLTVVDSRKKHWDAHSTLNTCLLYWFIGTAAHLWLGRISMEDWHDCLTWILGT